MNTERLPQRPCYDIHSFIEESFFLERLQDPFKQSLIHQIPIHPFFQLLETSAELINFETCFVI